MSTRDEASLTARERAMLAALEATAAAEDPQLASRLKGSGRLRAVTRLRVVARLPRVPVWARSGWWAVPMVLVGLALVVLSLSTVAAIGVVGMLVAAGGLWIAAGALERHLRARRPPG
jgi:hypothetical protein